MTAARFTIFAAVIAGMGFHSVLVHSNDNDRAAAQRPSGQLLLTSGDSYSGRLVDADRGDAIAWQTDIAAKPFLFPLTKLKSAEFPAGDAAVPKTGSYCFELNDGQAIYADLMAASDSRIDVDSQRFGRLSLDRNNVSRFYRHDGSRSDLADGLQGLTGWTIEGMPSDWREEAGGVATEIQGASLAREASLPAKFCVEIDAEWTPDTGVKFDFGDVFRIESWEDQLLLAREPGAKTLLSAADTQPAEWSYTFEEPAKDWYKPAFNVSSWKKGKSGFGSVGVPHGNVTWDSPDIWIRREFDMPSSPARPHLYINHDEDATVYINGVLAAQIPSHNGTYEIERISDAAVASLKPKGNVIAIHCHQTGGGQYIDAGLSAGGGGDGDFASIKCDEPNKIRLRCFVDRQAGTVKVVDFDGNVLSTVELKPSSAVSAEPEVATVRLTSYSSQLRVKQLVISEWDGGDPSQQSRQGAHLRLANGERVELDAIAMPEGGDQILVTANGESNAYPISDVKSVALGARRLDSSAPYWTNLSDGTVLSGEPVKVEAGALHLKTSLAEKALLVPLNEVRSLNNVAAPAVASAEPASTPTPAVKGADKTAAASKFAPVLEAEGIVSHGAIEAIAPTPETLGLAWQPADSLEAAPLLRTAQLKVQLREPQAAEASSPTTVMEDPQIALLRAQGLIGTPLAENVILEKPKSVPGLTGFEEFLVLTSGDRIPCRVVKFDNTGVYIESEVTPEKFIPANRIRVWESNRDTWLESLSEKKRQRLLTLPRKQRDVPPTHILESVTSDLMRARIMRGDEQNVYAAVGLKEQPIPRAKIQRIVWIPQVPKKKAEDAPAAPSEPEDAALETPQDGLVQALLDETFQVTMTEPGIAEGKLTGESHLLGKCAVSLDDVAEIRFGGLSQGESAKLVNAKWKLRDAIDPIYMQDKVLETEGRMTAGLTFPLVGQAAPSFSAPSLAGTTVQLRSMRGRVVILDFWASWCGPCIQALPEIVSVANSYDESKVELVSVNLGDDKESIAACLNRLKLAPTVAMDVEGELAKLYLVKSIPQTVIIDANGKVARVFVGSSPQLAKQLRFAIDELLAGN